MHVKFITLLRFSPGRPCSAVISLLALAAYPLSGQNFRSLVLGEAANVQEEDTPRGYLAVRGAPGADGHPAENRAAPATAAPKPVSAAVLLVPKPAGFNRDI